MTYKMMYHRIGEMKRWSNKPTGYDDNRAEVLGFKDIHFKKFREVYTSSHWMLRIYEVLDKENRDEEYESEWIRKYSEKMGEPEEEVTSNTYWKPDL